MNNKEFDACESFVETEEKDEERKVKELAFFLKKFQQDPDGQLLLALLHKICERFPAPPEYLNGPEEASVSCPCHAIHQVSLCGFALLEQVEVIVRGPGAG